MDPSFLDDRHGTEVFFFTGFVGEPRIMPGDLDVPMAQELLQVSIIMKISPFFSPILVHPLFS